MRVPLRPPFAALAARAALMAVLVPASPLLAEVGLEAERFEEGRRERDGGEGRRHERWAGPALFDLVSPADGALLTAGEEIVITWRGTEALAAERWIEEWEAFLSFDGGARYPIRITPHMGIDERSVVVRLPETASANARLLIRFGDERRELEHELPWTFEIASAERSVSAPRTPVFARGEAPRGGERGVVAWAEASRNGGGFRLLEAAGRALGIRDFRSGAGIAMPLLAPTSKGPILPSCALLSHPAGRAKRLVRPSTAEPRHEESIEPRERTCRINE